MKIVLAIVGFLAISWAMAYLTTYLLFTYGVVYAFALLAVVLIFAIVLIFLSLRD